VQTGRANSVERLVMATAENEKPAIVPCVRDVPKGLERNCGRHKLLLNLADALLKLFGTLRQFLDALWGCGCADQDFCLTIRRADLANVWPQQNDEGPRPGPSRTYATPGDGASDRFGQRNGLTQAG